MRTAYLPTRIAKGAPGYRIAADAISQRGGSFDIVNICDARWLDMHIESSGEEFVGQIIDGERALLDIVNNWEPGLDRARAFADLDAHRAQYDYSEREVRARFMIVDALTRCRRTYGDDEVRAFLDAYHPFAVELLDVFTAPAN